MTDLSQIREHMDVIGADGVHVGTVDKVEGDRIKLTKTDSGAGFEGGSHEGHHHFISQGLVAEIEGDQVRLSANADVAVTFEEEQQDSEVGFAPVLRAGAAPYRLAMIDSTCSDCSLLTCAPVTSVTTACWLLPAADSPGLAISSAIHTTPADHKSAIQRLRKMWCSFMGGSCARTG